MKFWLDGVTVLISKQLQKQLQDLQQFIKHTHFLQISAFSRFLDFYNHLYKEHKLCLANGFYSNANESVTKFDLHRQKLPYQQENLRNKYQFMFYRNSEHRNFI